MLDTIPLGEHLYCPLCGTELFDMSSDEEPKRCPHVVYTFVWTAADDDCFGYARADYAKEHVEWFKTTEEYKESLEEGDQPDEEAEKLFLSGKFKGLDKVSTQFAIAGDCQSLCPEHTVVFEVTGYYSGIRIAIDCGKGDD